MNDLKPTFEHYYPEGAKGGQCTTFLHNLLDFPPIGDSLKEKEAAVNKYGIRLADLHGNFQVGDIVISKDDPNHGHAYCVNAIVGNQLRATESNYHLDGKVHHTRIVPVSSLVYGVIRNAPLKVPIINPPTPMPEDPILYQFGFVTTQFWIVPQIQEAIAMILTASNQRLKVDPVVKENPFSSIPFTNGMVDADWYRQNILPARMFHMSNSEWAGGITNDEGWCTDDGIHFRADEKQTVYYPNSKREVKEFVANFVHELCHWICRTTGQPDITHQYMHTYEGIFDPAGAYSKLDYSKIK